MQTPFSSTSSSSSPRFPSPSQLSSPRFSFASPSQSSASLSAPPPSPPPIVLSPCAACKILRRKCAEKCVLAPYFPPNEQQKFIIAHRVFGASNIIKLLQELPENRRADAVSGMVYEAYARIRDPVYGCAGAISHLQKQVLELQAELAKAQAELMSMQCERNNLITLICTEMNPSQESMNGILQQQQQQQQQQFNIERTNMTSNLFDDNSCFDLMTWDPLWT